MVIGGPKPQVGMNKTCFMRRNYNREHIYKSKGIWWDLSWNNRLFPCEHSSPIYNDVNAHNKYVTLGKTILSEEWKGYQNLQQNYQQFIVNPYSDTSPHPKCKKHADLDETEKESGKILDNIAEFMSYN